MAKKFLFTQEERIAESCCGFCGFCGQVCYVCGAFVHKVRSLVASRKPANKLCGKQCGLAAGRERARLQGY